MNDRRTTREHYIRVKADIQPTRLKHLRNADWRQSVFGDITNKGTTISFKQLETIGPHYRLGLYGKKFYCEACLDAFFKDTLVIDKILQAVQLPRGTRGYSARFQYRLNGTAPKLDNIGNLEGLLNITSEPSDLIADLLAVSESTDPQFDDRLEATPGGRGHFSTPVVETLTSAPEDLRKLWRPRIIAGVWTMEAVRKPWLKYQLNQYRVPLPGERRSGQPSVGYFATSFNADLLNSFVRKNNNSKPLLYALLRDIVELPLRPSFRAVIWALMLQGLDGNSLVRELRDVADDLLKFSTSESEPWKGPLLLVIQYQARKNPWFASLLAAVEGQDSPLCYIASWAKKFRIEQSASGDSDQATGSIHQATPDTAGDLRSEDTALQKGAEARSPRFDQWILSQQGIDLAQVRVLCQEISQATSAIASQADSAHGVSDMLRLIPLLQQIVPETRKWLTALPDPQRRDTDLRAATLAYDASISLLGSEIDNLLQSGSFTTVDLLEAWNLFQRRDSVSLLPSWLIDRTSPRGELYATQSRLFEVLLDSRIRDRVRAALACVDESGAGSLAMLSAIPAPSVEEIPEVDSPNVDRYLRKSLAELRALVDELPPTIGSKLVRLEHVDKFEMRLRQCVALYRKLQQRITEEVVDPILERVLSAPDDTACIEEAELFEQAVIFLEKAIGTAMDAPFSQLQSWVNKNRSEVMSVSLNQASSATPSLLLEHNWTGKGEKAPLLYVASDDKSRPYGYVTAPLVLTTSKRISSIFSLHYKTITPHREGWPQGWEDAEPGELKISDNQWRALPDHPDRFIYTFGMRIPIRRRPEKSRFEIHLSITDATSKAVLVKATSFVWDEIRDYGPSSLSLKWPEVIVPDNVERHPIGPQKKWHELSSRLAQGGSFAVTAPRRFGKSTLIEFLRERANSDGFIVPPVVVCTNYVCTGGEFDYEKLWADVSSNLQSMVGSSLPSQQAGTIPEPSAFDFVRRSAHGKGKKGIVIFFDEAQVFFSSKLGPHVGDVLKDRLERHWSKASDKTPVMFGLIGLPSLRSRAGANLSGMLRPNSYDELEENELNSLLAAVTSGVLQTTREARQQLARTSGNMFILRSLVQRLLDHVSAEGRGWVNFNDVMVVESELCRDLRDGRDDGVSDYIRDALNDAEDINDWKPNTAMPLAIALAEANLTGAAPSKLSNAAHERIAQWYDSIPAQKTSRLVYDQKQLEEHLATLDERRIFQGNQFTSSLLQNWLGGYRARIQEQEWNSLLVRSAIRKVRAPELRQIVNGAEGGQARIWTFTQDNKKFAYRISELNSEEDRARFAETCEMLERLKSAVDDRAQGSEFIFKLRDFGISAEDDSKAVQTYRWIEGVDLAERYGKLPETYIADLGVKLSRALRFLHAHGVLHRDLSPRNIIIQDEGGDPVIIDFGFARSLEHKMHSKIDTNFAAPEVQRDNPKWTKAADVYALAATLKQLRKPSGGSTVLDDLFDACMKTKLEDRPDADKLASEFEDIAKKLELEQRKQVAWENVIKSCVVDSSQKKWFRGVLDKFEGNFKSAALGCYDGQFERCLEVASFLDQVFEKYVASISLQRKVTLGTINQAPQWKGVPTVAIQFIYTLRNVDNHSKKEPGYEIKKFRRLPDDKMREQILSGAKQLAMVVGITCLPEVVGHLLNPPGSR